MGSEQAPATPDPGRLAPDELHQLARQVLASESASGWENLSEAGLVQITQIWSANPSTGKHESELSLKDGESLQLAQDHEFQSTQAYQEYAAIIAEGSLDEEEQGKLKALLIEGKPEAPLQEEVEP